jgi:hypothetical protein
VLPPIEYPGILAPAAKDININSQIMDTYINNILPGQRPVRVLAVAAVSLNLCALEIKHILPQPSTSIPSWSGTHLNFAVHEAHLVAHDDQLD